jgi:hypothetical protein
VSACAGAEEHWLADRSYKPARCIRSDVSLKIVRCLLSIFLQELWEGCYQGFEGRDVHDGHVHGDGVEAAVLVVKH